MPTISRHTSFLSDQHTFIIRFKATPYNILNHVHVHPINHKLLLVIHFSVFCRIRGTTNHSNPASFVREGIFYTSGIYQAGVHIITKAHFITYQTIIFVFYVIRKKIITRISGILWERYIRTIKRSLIRLLSFRMEFNNDEVIPVISG